MQLVAHVSIIPIAREAHSVYFSNKGYRADGGAAVALVSELLSCPMRYFHAPLTSQRGAAARNEGARFYREALLGLSERCWTTHDVRDPRDFPLHLFRIGGMSLT